MSAPARAKVVPSAFVSGKSPSRPEGTCQLMRPARTRVPPWPVTDVTNGFAPVTAAVLLLGDRNDRKHHFPPNFLIETFYRDFGGNTLFRSPRSPRLCPLTSSETKRPVTFGHSGHHYADNLSHSQLIGNVSHGSRPCSAAGYVPNRSGQKIVRTSGRGHGRWRAMWKPKKGAKNCVFTSRPYPPAGYVETEVFKSPFLDFQNGSPPVNA